MSILRRAAPFSLLVVLNVLFRLPPLLNAAGVHSDAAIVGLQAMHFLHGETSRFIWGARYQGTFDVWVIAGLFALGGPSALKLMLAPLLGHVILCFFAWSVLARRLAPWMASVICLPLVFTPHAINSVALYAPRQWCLTFLFAAIWLIDRASIGRWGLVKLGLGLFCGAFALYLDIYGLQVLVPIVIFAAFAACDAPRTWERVGVRMAAGVAGLVLGILLVQYVTDSSVLGQTRLDLRSVRLAANWQLFRDTCLPFLLGAKVFIAGGNLYPDLWQPPAVVKAWQFLGAATFVIFILLAPALALVRRVPWEVRRLGLLGAGAAMVSTFGFLGSRMPFDVWAVRYLAPIIWLAPFALAPLAYLVTTRRMMLMLTPYLTVAAVGGWLAFGAFVNGPLPRLDARGQAREEFEVAAYLRSQNIQAASAHYWLAYRLSFLFQEHPIVVPMSDERYAPYREAFDKADRVAYIFHPGEPRATPQQILPGLAAQGGRVERVEVAGFTLLIHDRRAVK